MKGPVEQHLAPPLSDAQIQSIARTVQAARHARRSLPWRSALAAAGAAATLALGLWVAHREPTPLRTADGVPLPSSFQGELAFSDGSQVTLDDGARAEVVANQVDQITLLLRKGRGRFQVNPESHKRWVVQAGLASVEVLGTVFTVERTPQGVAVAVERGVVLVRSDALPDGLQRLEAGNRTLVAAQVPPPPAPPSAPEPSAPVEPIEPQALPSSRSPPPPPPSPPAALAPDWRRLAEQGDFADAWGVLEPAFAPTVDASVDREELLLMADTARSTGHADEAARALERRLDLAPDDAAAAFTLGRLELERRDRPLEAAERFAQAARGTPASPLRYDALVRRVEALRRAGEQDRAAQAAREVLREFPNGAHTARLEKWLLELEGAHP
jgi:transmembrane sensor